MDLEQNIIAVVSPVEVEHMTVFLIPKADPEVVWKRMALPDRHVYTFNMSIAKPNPAGNVPYSPCFLLPFESHRYPTVKLDGLEMLFRTWFLGHAEDTINDHIRDVVDLLDKVKAQTMKLPGR